MTNKYADHLLVLPEDDANRRLVNGFLKHAQVRHRAVQVLPEAGGWRHVLAALQNRAVVHGLINYPHRHFLMLIDFDQQAGTRLQDYANCMASLPDAARRRVYLLGSLETPEQLRAACGLQLEDIGGRLAQDCPPGSTGSLWSHPHLQHNAGEASRLTAQVRPFLFEP
jgi:hypothetical protein